MAHKSWFPIRHAARAGVYRKIFESAEISSLNYWLEIFFAAGIATFGLVENSPAVIIGAMLISPLMGPIMATGLALAVGDFYLGIKALASLLASVIVSILFSAFLVWLLPFHSATVEILSRTKPNLLDLGIALLCGLAGSLVVCRGAGDGVTALPGVAIAVALMPPLCTMGFGLGSGMNLEIVGGSGLLFLTNLVAIVATAFGVFLLIGMNSPEVEEAMLGMRGDEPFARTISEGRFARVLAIGRQPLSRVLMVLILLASIAVPLRRALLQVASETRTRGAVEDTLRRLKASNAIVSQQVSIGKNDIAIRLISTSRIPEVKLDEARQDLLRRTGREVQLSVEAVASKSEIADLMERLAQPPPIVTKEKTFAEMQKELFDKVTPPLQEIWPFADAPIQDYDVAVGSTGVTVEVRYQADKDLGDIPVNMVLQNLRTKLAMPDLAMNATRVKPPRTNPRTTKTAREPAKKH